MLRSYGSPALLVLMGLLLSSGVGLALAEVVPGSIVIKQADPLGPSTVSSLNAPFTDSRGRVGFVGALADAQRFIWWDNGVNFYSNDALPDVLTGGESTMGVSDNGGFVYSPSFDGADAVYSHLGKILADDDPWPPNPLLYNTFNSRPTMQPDGTAYWVAGSTETLGGSTTNRALLKAVPPYQSANITRVLGGGDLIEGISIKTSANNFDYDISDDSMHHIQVLDMNATLNEHVFVDGGFAAAEGGATGQGDNWQTFDFVAINNSGDYLFTGDTDGLTTVDEFVAYNGQIAVREGDTLDGVTIQSGATLRAVSINNSGQAVQLWGVTATEWLFWGPANDMSSSTLLLMTGDEIDIDNDQVGDYAVTDFGASGAVGPGLDLAEDGYVFVNVDLTPPGGTALQAVIRISAMQVDAVDGNGISRPFDLRVVPNPMFGRAEIRWVLPGDGFVRMTVHDAAGRRVRGFIEQECAAGALRVDWDGRDDGGTPVPAGTYFLRAAAGGNDETARITVLR